MKPPLFLFFLGLGILLWGPHAVFGDSGKVPLAASEQSPSSSFTLVKHHLTVQLVPGDHRLVATDRLTLTIVKDGAQELSFVLSMALRVHRLDQIEKTGRRALSFSTNRGSPHESSPQPSPAGMQQILVQLPHAMQVGQQVTLECSYEGTVHQPPRSSSHLRFVAPDQTAGHIGQEGVYLSGETHWYLHHQGSLPIFQLDVSVPRGWEVVTHGQETARHVQGETTRTTWMTESKTEALTLVANQFVKDQRTWQGIELSTYLFSDDAHLSPVYLEAIERYLTVYSTLLGPYPFPKFSVVENFFPSGLGMPSFTLLGSGVIKRRYIQPYALGHEIVHSWIGNWTFNDVEQGNWVEGLTTYLANYYYEELTGTKEQAQEQRRRMLLGYAVYVSAEEDYPLREFRFKTEQKDNAIGYQKAAMVFHMLRREIGEEFFWVGIRNLLAHHAEAYATWEDVEQEMSAAAGKPLRWFFAQWVERKGAPLLALKKTRVLSTAMSSPSRTDLHLEFQLRQLQQEPMFRLSVPVQVFLEDGSVLRTTFLLEQPEQTYRLFLPGEPREVRIDPEFELFQRLARRSLPPMLNLYVTDRHRSLVVPDKGSDAEQELYHKLGDQILSRQEGQTIARRTPSGNRPSTGSVLVLGGPQVNSLAPWAIEGCGKEVQITDKSFSVGGQTYASPDMALLVSCSAPHSPDSMVTLFYGLTPSAAGKVARLLFFYGWESFVVFRDGKVISRGDFSTDVKPLEVRIDAP